jgi:two-component system chemotaxis sensor kinase CheA
MDLDHDVLRRLFFEESEKGLGLMEEALACLEASPEDRDSLQTLFRVAHTLKGNAGSLGFVELGSLTRGLESTLERLGEGSVALSRDLVDGLLESVDALRRLLAEARALTVSVERCPALRP